MKILIGGNAMGYHEIGLYFDNYCKDLIIKELSKKFDNLEGAYNYLVKSYNKILEEKGLNPYKSYCINKEAEQKIFSLLLSCGRENENIYYATILKMAEKMNLEFLNLFLVMYVRVNYYSKEKFGTKIIIKKEFIKEFLSLLKESYKEGLFVSSKKVTECLADIVNNTKTPVQDKAIGIIKDIENNIEKLDYILIEEADESLNDFNTYKSEIGINYKDIILNKGFQEYLEDLEEINDIDDLDDIVCSYIEESGEISDKINNYMIKNNEGCFLNKDILKNLKVNEKSLIEELYKN